MFKNLTLISNQNRTFSQGGCLNSRATTSRNATSMVNSAINSEDYAMRWNLTNFKIEKLHYGGNFPNLADEEKVSQALSELIQRPSRPKEEKIKYKELSCTKISMNFFDKLYTHQPNIVHNSGRIHACFQDNRNDICPGVVFRDQLVKALLNYDEDEYFVFSDADRKEFLFRIFQFLVIGGPINQYEDEIGIYIEGTRSLYKDMVSVSKNKDGEICVDSKVFEVYVETIPKDRNNNDDDDNDGDSDDDESRCIFPDNASSYDFVHPQSFCYVVVNEKDHLVTVFQNIWTGNKF